MLPLAVAMVLSFPGNRMSVRRSIAAFALAWLVTEGLWSQGYETKFKATGFKPGDVYHTDEGVHVALTGGGLEVELPLGPALPGPIPIRPVIHYHGKYSQPLNPNWSYGEAFRDGMIGRDWSPGEVDAFEKAYRRWSPPSLPFGEAHPGHLLFRAGSTAMKGSSTEPDITLHSPFGHSTSYHLGMPGSHTYSATSRADVAEVELLAQTLAPEWDRNAAGPTDPGCAILPGTPVFTSLGTTLGVRLSGGTTLIFGPSGDRIFRRWTASTAPITSELLQVPHEILLVDKDFITLWRRNRNVYHQDWDPKDVNGTLADYRWTQSVYHPVWIKTRSGFRADVAIYRNAPKGRMACLTEGGILTGYRVSTNDGATWFQVGKASDDAPGPSVQFGGMDVAEADGGTFSGLTPPRPAGSDGTSFGDFQPGTTTGYEGVPPSPFHWELEYTSASLLFSGTSVSYGGLSTALEWGGPQGQLSRLTTPSGKTYAFTYELIQGVGTNPRSSVSGISWLWNPATPSALDFYSMVTRMNVQENATGSAQTRSTSYRWKLPEVGPASATGLLRWSSPSQGVAQTLPTGETILHIYSPPIDEGTGSSRLEEEGRTFLATRQAVTGRYHYAAGDRSWESFFTTGADPGTTGWFARERFEGWDLRSWERQLREPRGANPTFLGTNTEPRPTRTIKEEKDGPVEVTERDAWDPDGGRYAILRSYVLAAGSAPAAQVWAPGSMQGLNAPLGPGETTFVRRPGLSEASPTGSLAHQVTLTAYSTDKGAALFDREEKAETLVILAPASGARGFAARRGQAFESGARAHIVKQADQLDLNGGTGALSLTFNQQPLGLFTVNRLQGVTLGSNLPGTALSDLVGATYEYEATGRFMTGIQQRGVTWRAQEPDHDTMGRPLTQKDPNGFATGYTWDTLGRLTRMSPQSPESDTTILHAPSLRRISLSRGSQSRVYHYNGFGELVGEERTGPGGQVSHRILGHDAGGRRTFETTWRRGPITDLAAWAAPRTSAPGLATWEYDGRGRVIRTVNANGEVTDTEYPTPLQTLKKTHPDIEGKEGLATTTFDRDVLGRLVKVTDAKGQVSSYAYDPAGRIRLVQQGSQIRTWAYDPFGRLETLVQPESGTTKFGGFTVTGKPTWTTYGHGSAAPRTVTTTFDSLSRPLTLTSSDGTVDQLYAYDGGPAGGRTQFGSGLGQLTYGRDRGIELWYVYDGLNGRLGGLDTRVGDGDTPSESAPTFRQVFGHAFDGLRQSASIDGRIQRLSLEPASRLPQGVTHGREDGYTLTVANLTQDEVAWVPARIDYGNGAFTTLGYRPDQMGLAAQSHGLPGSDRPRLSWTYNYDGAGQLRGDGQDTYAYDALGRLTRAMVQRTSVPQQITQDLTYDAVGNLLSSLSTANAGPLPATLTNFAFPAQATELAQRNQLPAAHTGARYDSQGHLTYVWKSASPSGPFLQMAYDALGRVSSLFDSATGITEAYAYTPEGLRTRIDLYSQGALQKTRYRIYNDQRQLVSEYETLRAEKQEAVPAPRSTPRKSTSGTPAKPPRKHALVLADGRDATGSRSSSGLPKVRYRNNDGTFPGQGPTLIDTQGPAGAYITYPIGAITVPLGESVSFTGTTDHGTDYSWDFGDGTPAVYGSFEAGSRTTPPISHTFNALNGLPFQVTYTVRNTAGGYTQSTATLSVSVVRSVLPVIHSFTANGLRDTATVYWGDPATLAWEVSGAESLRVDAGVGPVEPRGEGTVVVPNLQTTTTFTLTATNAAGSVSQGVRVRVLPKVLSFAAEANPIEAGTETRLVWTVAGATGLTLQDGSGPVQDMTGEATRTVAPLEPATYTLVASNADGAAPPVALALSVSPVIQAFNATPDTIAPGGTSTLSWRTVGTNLTLRLEPAPGAISGTDLVVAPTSTTTYQLTATNGFTSVSRWVTVALGEPPTILLQPLSQAVTAGQAATFRVIASSPAPFSVQWLKNGVPIPGASEASYTTPPTTLAEDGGSYVAELTGTYGTARSQPAVLSVAADAVAPTVSAFERGTRGSIILEAVATDNIGIARVEFFLDGELVGTAPAAPHRIDFDSTRLVDGHHSLLAKAFDPSGNQGASPTVVFSIDNSPEAAPQITAQPVDQAVKSGQSATFAVTALGSAPLAYQWFATSPGTSQPIPIGGATETRFTTAPAALAENGTTYTVVISNPYGSVTSSPALLTVGSDPSQVGRLVWKRDIVYIGTHEVGEVDLDGLHITQVDHLGTPRLLSDRNGTLEDEQKFMPFGQPLEGLQKAGKGFTGHEQTDPSGLIYMQARFYAPMYGRFLSPDPARDQHFEETQSWNIYSYVQNNPIMHTDPNGEKLVAIRLQGFKNVSVQSKTRGSIIVVDKTLVPRVMALIHNAEERGQKLVITSTFRTNSEQSGLSSTGNRGDGRTGESGGKVVTPAPAGSSPHNAGLGVDAVAPGTSSVPGKTATDAKGYGMRYGGDFKKPDPVHVDGAKDASTRQKLTTENQQQFSDKSQKIESYTYDKKTYTLRETTIVDKEMRR